jgi:vacuolar-type H+-ATPase subunit I/STV1
MFGDFGHGFFVTVAALYMILNEKGLQQNKGEVCIGSKSDIALHWFKTASAIISE